MKRSRCTEERIIGLFREREAGAGVADVCRRHGMSSATSCAWTSKSGAGAGRPAPPVRQPAAACPATARGPWPEPQEDPAALSRGWAGGASAQGAADRRGAHTDRRAGGAEQPLVGRFRPRPARDRAAVPDAQHHRQCQQGMPCGGRRHLPLRQAPSPQSQPCSNSLSPRSSINCRAFASEIEVASSSEAMVSARTRSCRRPSLSIRAATRNCPPSRIGVAAIRNPL